MTRPSVQFSDSGAGSLSSKQIVSAQHIDFILPSSTEARVEPSLDQLRWNAREGVLHIEELLAETICFELSEPAPLSLY